jgi:hypothetical protein
MPGILGFNAILILRSIPLHNLRAIQTQLSDCMNSPGASFSSNITKPLNLASPSTASWIRLTAQRTQNRPAHQPVTSSIVLRSRYQPPEELHIGRIRWCILKPRPHRTTASRDKPFPNYDFTDIIMCMNYVGVIQYILMKIDNFKLGYFYKIS